MISSMHPSPILETSHVYLFVYIRRHFELISASSQEVTSSVVAQVSEELIPYGLHQAKLVVFIIRDEDSYIKHVDYAAGRN